MAKQAHRVRNWKEYNKALIQRGSITLWFNKKVIRNWYDSQSTNSSRGHPKIYSDMAIETCLILRTIFNLSLRAIQGFVTSLFQLLGITIKIPSYTQLCRRQKNLNLILKHNIRGPIHMVVDGTGLKIFGEGEWKVRQHGYVNRRMWRKLHVGVDVKSQQIVTMKLTDNDVGENKKFEELLAQYQDGYTTIGGDKGYDSYDCHEQVGKYNATSAINIQTSAKERKKIGKGEPLVRDEIIRRIAKVGKDQWKKEVQYHKRSLVETTFFRYKTIFGSRMRARNIENQKKESLIACNILNAFASISIADS